jgi:hypothetical protein
VQSGSGFAPVVAAAAVAFRFGGAAHPPGTGPHPPNGGDDCHGTGSHAIYEQHKEIIGQRRAFPFFGVVIAIPPMPVRRLAGL